MRHTPRSGSSSPRERRSAGILASSTLSALALASAFAFLARAQVDSTVPPDGLRENTPNVHALVNAKLVLSPGRVIEKGSLVLRDGAIVAIGSSDGIKPPADARVWDLSGKTIYPGLIDAYGEAGGDAPAAGRGGAGGGELLRTAQPAPAPAPAPAAAGGAAHWNARVTPQNRIDRQYRADTDANGKLRAQGVVARLVAPSRQVIKGISAAVSTLDDGGAQSILKPAVAMHLQLTPGGGGAFGSGERVYPVSPMGAVAVVRQAMLDTQWYARAWAAYEGDSTLPRPERNEALEALLPAVRGEMPVVIDSGDEIYSLRADRIAREFKLNLILRGSGQEYRRIDEIAATGRPVILPIEFARPPNVASPEAAIAYSLEDLMDWDLQPENPARLEKAGVKFALTTQGLRDRATFLANVRKAVARGLSKDGALRAMTTVPAELLGLSRTHGTLEAGKSASLVVTDGDLFDTRTKVIETWVDGQRFEITPSPKTDPRGTWAINVEGARPVTVEITGEANRPRGRLVSAAGTTRPTTRPASRPAGQAGRGRGGAGAAPGGEQGGADALANLAITGAQLSFTFKGDSVGMEGVVQISATVSGDSWIGLGLKPDGASFTLTATRTAKATTSPATTRPVEEVAAAPKADESPVGERERPTTQTVVEGAPPATQPAPAALARQAERASTQPALFEVNYPLGAFGRSGKPEQHAAVLFKNATVWTSGPRGKLAGASVLVQHGKITGVFAKDEDAKNVTSDALVIDCTGMHLSPGIMDAHSHIATDGGINEGSQSVTCEVRIGDFLDPDDINIYRQLAGGVTAAHVLHGSANTIGGQSQLIKMRWGASDHELKFAEAPPTVKFALGENVKRSSSETSTRYPRTRMGVEQVVRDSFQAAKEYRQAWNEYRRTGAGAPPRKDLELEALCEILDGRRLIHCHSYRQDEILAFLRVCEEYGVKVAVLQHILEGYKVADVMAKHGAGGSSFSDWWAYKWEVWDAIPYNGALMREAGVTVSFNSDDAELARRLNLEAAKAVKYGNVPEEEALKFVTLNPAKQLRVDAYVGSIEVGKHADLVVWSASPLSTFTRCEQTWVDGRRYFDRKEDAQMRKENQRMRAALVQKILGAGETLADAGEREQRPRDVWRHDASTHACECGVHLQR